MSKCDCDERIGERCPDPKHDTSVQTAKKNWDRARERAAQNRNPKTWLPSTQKLCEDECMRTYDAYQKALEREAEDKQNCIELGSVIEILSVTLEKIKWLTEEVYEGPDTLKGRITLNNMMEAHRRAEEVLVFLDLEKRIHDPARKRVAHTLQRMRDADDGGRFLNPDPSTARVLPEKDSEPSKSD